MPAGNLHAYLRGAGVEIMAASDNVLRGGLTPKHVDVAELLRVLRFEVLADPVRAARPVAPGCGLLARAGATTSRCTGCASGRGAAGHAAAARARGWCSAWPVDHRWTMAPAR